ncbi:MAG: HAD-IIIA family hydrolase [Planctomycetota bacterium]
MAIFDRDGTLIVDRGYLSDPDGVALLPGAGATLAALKARGYRLCLAINQSGIGRGMYGVAACAAVTRRLEALAGVAFDAVEICPHRPDEGCACRKPRPAMLERLLARLGCDRRGSFMAGDKQSDIEAGRACGLRTVWCDFGGGGRAGAIADRVVRDLPAILDCLEND